jgi:hypothetical protein
LFRIDTLTMIRLKQDDLAKIGTLRIYLLTQLDAFGRLTLKNRNKTFYTETNIFLDKNDLRGHTEIKI